jgi:phosphoserine phosphatase
MNSVYKGKLDLLIIDIDDTFVYHRTVAAANKIFLNLFGVKLKDKMYTTKKSIFLVLLNFFRFRFQKKIIKLFLIGFYLHLLNMIREINNRFFDIMSSEKVIKVWVNTVIRLGMKSSEYQLSRKALKNNLNKRVLEIYNSLRKSNPNMKVLAMTQSFTVNGDPIKEILGVDMIETNRFISKNGIIVGSEINIKDGQDKKKIAERAIKKLKAKNIALFVDDYDDALLLKLKNLRFVLYKKKLKRFMQKEDNDVIKICFK